MDDDTTIINVKGVRKAAWNAATRAAALAKTPYGPWLSDAIDQRLYREATGGNPEGKAGLTEDQITARTMALAEMAKGMAAMKSAGLRVPAVVRMALMAASRSTPHRAGRPGRRWLRAL